MSALLSCQNLSWRVGVRQVLQGVDFAVAPGEVVGLLGPNGSGKSSVLRALMGLLRPESGSLQFAGEALPFGHRTLRQAMGVVFQGQSLDGKLTVRHNLELGAALFGLRGPEAARRIEATLQFVELATRAHERCDVLSGGMRRRLELARALLPAPRLLLLDEPTQGLDPVAQERLWQRLDAARKESGLCILLSTHDAFEAARCDRVLVLDGGRTVAYDTPQNLLARAGGDVLCVQPAHGVGCEALAEAVQAGLGLSSRQEDGQLLVQQADGHLLVPRLVDVIGAARIRGIALRRPSLADAFYHVAGSALGARAGFQPGGKA